MLIPQKQHRSQAFRSVVRRTRRHKVGTLATWGVGSQRRTLVQVIGTFACAPSVHDRKVRVFGGGGSVEKQDESAGFRSHGELFEVVAGGHPWM